MLREVCLCKNKNAPEILDLEHIWKYVDSNNNYCSNLELHFRNNLQI